MTAAASVSALSPLFRGSTLISRPHPTLRYLGDAVADLPGLIVAVGKDMFDRSRLCLGLNRPLLYRSCSRTMVSNRTGFHRSIGISRLEKNVYRNGNKQLLLPRLSTVVSARIAPIRFLPRSRFHWSYSPLHSHAHVDCRSVPSPCSGSIHPPDPPNPFHPPGPVELRFVSVVTRRRWPRPSPDPDVGSSDRGRFRLPRNRARIRFQPLSRCRRRLRWCVSQSVDPRRSTPRSP